MHLSLNNSMAAAHGDTKPADLGKRPNILFLLSDDHGQWAADAYGNEGAVKCDRPQTNKRNHIMKNGKELQ